MNRNKFSCTLCLLLLISFSFGDCGEQTYLLVKAKYVDSNGEFSSIYYAIDNGYMPDADILVSARDINIFLQELSEKKLSHELQAKIKIGLAEAYLSGNLTVLTVRNKSIENDQGETYSYIYQKKYSEEVLNGGMLTGIESIEYVVYSPDYWPATISDEDFYLLENTEPYRIRLVSREFSEVTAIDFFIDEQTRTVGLWRQSGCP